MAAPLSRLERLVKVIGEENLPPKLTKESVQQDEALEAENGNGREACAPGSPSGKPKPLDGSIDRDEQQSSDWWDVTPAVLERARRPYQNPHLRQASDTTPTKSPFPFDNGKGNPAPLGFAFVPFLAVTKFPYKFVKKEFMQAIASEFFDQNKIYDREWDIYYIWSEHFPTAKAITFVPHHQLLALVDEIKDAFPKASVAVTEQHREYGLVIDFDDLGGRPDLRPCWLGRSSSRGQYEYWVDNLPIPNSAESAAVSNGHGPLKVFKEKMELAISIAKNRSKGGKTTKHAGQFAKMQNMVQLLHQTQKYLGLSPQIGEGATEGLPDLSSLSLSLGPDVILIAVDVEAWERAPHYVTEVGVATLDTRDIVNQDPGEVGKNWQQFIQARHFCVAEYKSYINKDFVTGCPWGFEFGKSEDISKADLGKELAKCFKPPYHQTGSRKSDEKRGIVLVGHDVSQDIIYLQKAGYNVLNSGDLVDQLDTAEISRAYTTDPNPRSLGGILYDFELSGWNLHNAGNDAVYTIWALLAMALKSSSGRASTGASQRQAECVEPHTEADIQASKDAVRDETGGLDEPGDDGGVPV